MLITCTSCQKALSLADDKVPSRPFVLTCPSCQHRQQIDPSTQLDMASLPLADEGEGGAEEVEIDAGPDGFIPLPNLRRQDAALLERLAPESFVVNLSSQPAYQLTAGLRLIGSQNVQHFTDLASACKAMKETEVGVLVVVMDKASAPPCPPLAPLHQLPIDVRRRTYVVLMADNVRSLDGQVAFYLQVNCLVNSQDMIRFPVYLRRGLLYHQRLYRAWSEEIEAD